MRRLQLAVMRVISMITGTWDYRRRDLVPKDSGRRRHAFCDGWLIGKAPWLCFCCLRARLWLEGRRWTAAWRPWLFGMPMDLRFFTVHTAERGIYVWPSVKWVYPTQGVAAGGLFLMRRGMMAGVG